MSIFLRLPSSVSPLLQWLVYRSGIPTLIFLAGLVAANVPAKDLLAGGVLGLPGLLLFERGLRQRACDQPMRLFLLSFTSLVVATLAAWLAPLARGAFLFSQRLDRLERMRELQQVIGEIWSVEALAVVLLAWLILTLSARLLRPYVPAPPHSANRPSIILRGMAALLVLGVLANLAVAYYPPLAVPPYPHFHGLSEGGGSSRLLSPRDWDRYKQLGGKRAPFSPPVFEAWPEGELLQLYRGVASRLAFPHWKLDQKDISLVRSLETALERFEQRSPSGPLIVDVTSAGSMAEFVCATLIAARSRERESMMISEVYRFRSIVLPYLAQAQLSKTEIEAWQTKVSRLVISPSTSLNVRQFRRLELPEDEPPLQMLGATGDESLAEMYFELEGRWCDLRDDILGYEAKVRRLQPEAEGLRLVLAIKEQKLLTGSYPATLSTELGTYAADGTSASLTLHAMDVMRGPITLKFL